jgi:hypothetical protein
VTQEGSTQPTQASADAREQRAAVERALMDRTRVHVAREHEPPPRLLRNTIGFAVTLALLAIVLFGLDAFLTAMQKYMETTVVDPAPAPTDPMPAYAVPAEVSPPPPVDQGPRPSPAQAPETSQATP